MNRKLLLILILSAIIVVALYRLAGWHFDWSLFVSSLWNVQPGWLTASIAATLLTYVARAFRWKVLLNPLKSIRMGPLISPERIPELATIWPRRVRASASTSSPTRRFVVAVQRATGASIGCCSRRTTRSVLGSRPLTRAESFCPGAVITAISAPLLGSFIVES